MEEAGMPTYWPDTLRAGDKEPLALGKDPMKS